MAEGVCKICGGPHSTGECLQEKTRGEKQPDIAKCSEDGKHSISLSHEDGKDVVITDGKREEYPQHKDESGEWDHHIVDVSISPDGEHFGLVRKTEAGSESSFVILVDKKPVFTFERYQGQAGRAANEYSPHWTAVRQLSISNGGKHWACLAEDFNADREEITKLVGKKVALPYGEVVVLDGKVMTKPVWTATTMERTPERVRLTLSKTDDRFTFEGGIDSQSDKDIIINGSGKGLIRKIVKGKGGEREAVTLEEPFYKLS